MANKESVLSYKILNDGDLTSPKGYKASGVHCGLKRKKLDFGWIFSDVPAVAAGVYTTNLFQAPPLKVTQESLAVEQKLQGIVINSGNANACTGELGMANAYDMRKTFSEKMNIADHFVGVVSTGVIGQQLPMDKIYQGIEQVSKDVSNAEAFQTAILTTDTRTKHVAVTIKIDGKDVTIGGAAKGSGMIHPNMATMLGFVTTDANIEQADLYQALKGTTNQTFNMITVDGDTSTNDMVLVLANGLAENEKLTTNHSEWEVFLEAFNYVCETLAKKIARDGEGATKLIEVQVTGAKDEAMAKVVSKSIVGSNLVKTAVFGSDPNWGRIICSIGYSGEPINVNEVTVSLGEIPVVKKGLPCTFSEEEAFDYLNQETIHIYVDLGEGEAHATAWGCDLTYDYVQINASYRT